VRGSFRAPAPAPSGSFRRPERPPSDARSESIRAPSAAPRSAAAASVAAPSRPRARGDAAKEPRLGAPGEVITEYAGSREAGWRGAGADAIDESIRQMLAAGRKGAAARIAWDAGRHEQALEWFLELDLHYQAGACLRALGRHQE